MEEIKSVADQVCNWGRWGSEDERGTLNFVTPDKVIDGARMVRLGRVFSMAIPLNRDGPQLPDHRRFNPIHVMLKDGGDFRISAEEHGMGGADDLVIMPLQCATQWDALAHAFYNGQLYNGFSSDTISSDGAARDGIDKVTRGIVCRGVLLDLARSLGLEALPPGFRISVSQLDSCIRQQRVDIRTGDALLIRTGHILAFVRDGDRDAFNGDAAGLGLDCVAWLHSHEVSVVCTDTVGVEVQPSAVPGIKWPLHALFLRDMGMMLGEMFYLEELAEDCASDSVYEFLFVAPPLPITGAVGSPINPLAVK